MAAIAPAPFGALIEADIYFHTRFRWSTAAAGEPGATDLESVALHELGHLLVAGHGPDFWAVLSSYPRLERARGYLDGVAAASGLALSDD